MQHNEAAKIGNMENLFFYIYICVGFWNLTVVLFLYPAAICAT